MPHQKYYPVFISSTKKDLEDLRLNVEHTLMRTKFLPIGMENFTASNKSVWEVIASRIDAASFVVLIIGDRYGDFDEESQKSYTQREYEYAIEKNIPVLAFIKEDPIADVTYDVDTTKLAKLDEFKKLVLRRKKLAHTWKNNERNNLPADILAALENSLADMIASNEAPRGLVSDRDLDLFTRPKETIMNFYNVHAVVKGSKEDCENGTAIVTYIGSAAADGPDRPVVYEDRVKSSLPILYHHFTPQEKLIKEDEFKRNPRTLEYRIVSDPNADRLYFTGEIRGYIQLRECRGGILLHIPYFTQTATLFVDISNIPFVKDYHPKAVIWRFDEIDGVQKPFEEVELIMNEDNLTYAITARNIPADSNIGLSWNNEE